MRLGDRSTRILHYERSLRMKDTAWRSTNEAGLVLFCRAGSTLMPVLDGVIWHLARSRWAEAERADLKVRLDKGFFSRTMVQCLRDLGVSLLLKAWRAPKVRISVRGDLAG